MHPADTVVALATAPLPGARAIVRISGRDCRRVLAAVVRLVRDLTPGRLLPGEAALDGVPSPLPVGVLWSAAPKSYTGEDVAEVHCVSCVPLVEALVAAFLKSGARAANPGEFTMRAFLAGKLDLTRAEAVQAVIDAGGRGELRDALAQLAGGMAKPLSALREDLLNLLADVEAGLDFADEDIRFVDNTELLTRIARAIAHVTTLSQQIDRRALSDATFRAALVGRPNAGKSSLFNALAGASAIVSEVPGTTRDFLAATIELAGLRIELTDTPGREEGRDDIEREAQRLARARAAEADALLVCVEAGATMSADDAALAATPGAVVVATKCDTAEPLTGIPTSATTRAGLGEVRKLLVAGARAKRPSSTSPTVSRCRDHVARCLEHLRRAHLNALEDDPPEILALELREALQQLGEMTGAVYTDDILDRVFTRFCIGK